MTVIVPKLVEAAHAIEVYLHIAWSRNYCCARLPTYIVLYRRVGYCGYYCISCCYNIPISGKMYIIDRFYIVGESHMLTTIIDLYPFVYTPMTVVRNECMGLLNLKLWISEVDHKTSLGIWQFFVSNSIESCAERGYGSCGWLCLLRYSVI